MIYLASRSAWKYLRKLREISQRQDDYHLVSITGGLACIHAVSPRTRSLLLVDSDPEVNDYGQNMLQALLHCPTRRDFFELLSGREVEISESGKVVFLHKESARRAIILSTLPPSSAECIHRWYVPNSFNDESATMTVEDKTIHFFGLSLQIQHFNWHADWGIFSEESSYRELVEALARLNPTFLTLPLEHFDFASCLPGTLILASNTDSPLFTQRDAVLSPIEASGSTCCAYISRTRDFSSVPPERTELRKEILKLPPILVGLPDEVLEELREIVSPRYIPMTYDHYYGQLFYDEELILFWAGEESSAERLVLIDHLKIQQPIHQRVGVITPLGEGDPIEIVNILTRYQPQDTVLLEHLRVTVLSLSFRIPY